MGETRTDGLPKRVQIVGDHPWAGHTGTVVEAKWLAGAEALHVELDRGDQGVEGCFVFPGEWRVLDA